MLILSALNLCPCITNPASPAAGLVKKLKGTGLEADLPMLRVPEKVTNIGILMITGQRGLCGPYNAFVIKKVQAHRVRGWRMTLSRIGGQRNAKNSSMLGWRKDLQLTGSTMLILEDGPEDGCFFSVLARFSIPDIRLLHGRSLFREEIKGCANFRVHCISFPTACSGTAWYCRWLMVSIFNGHFRNLNWRYLLYIRPM